MPAFVSPDAISCSSILISTIFLPAAVTVIPLYTFFVKIHLVGTWLPLILPHYFANAYNVFLLRQYFLTIPRELDEAATVDGAGPLRVLWSIILPQSKPVLLAISVFHIVFAWNDFFGPLIYLKPNTQLYPISVALQYFVGLYAQQTGTGPGGRADGAGPAHDPVRIRPTVLHPGHRYHRR